LEETEKFSLTELGSLSQGIQDYSSEDTFLDIKESLPALSPAEGFLNLQQIKQIAMHIKSETS